jgi:hypothetical protein
MSSRPPLAPWLRATVQALCSASPELERVDPRLILFVAGSARRDARASVRPLTYGGAPPSRWSPDRRYRRPEIVIEEDGALFEVRYEICLRPRFFLDATPTDRLDTLIHELLHLHPRFDGTLDPARSHRRQRAPEAERIAEIRAAFEARVGPDAAARAWLSWEGELSVQAWLRRPPTRIPAGAPVRIRYDQRDLYPAIVNQVCRRRPS